MRVSKEIIAWRTILEVLKQTGNYEMYDEEIELVANEIKKIKEQDKEIERLHSIIKEAIEYIGIDENITNSCDMFDVNGIELYKILKGSDKE